MEAVNSLDVPQPLLEAVLADLFSFFSCEKEEFIEFFQPKKGDAKLMRSNCSVFSTP